MTAREKLLNEIRYHANIADNGHNVLKAIDALVAEAEDSGHERGWNAHMILSLEESIEASQQGYNKGRAEGAAEERNSARLDCDACMADYGRGFTDGQAAVRARVEGLIAEHREMVNNDTQGCRELAALLRAALAADGDQTKENDRG